MKQELNKESSERLREKTTQQLSELLGALLRAAQKAHGARVASEITRAQFSSALDDALDEIATNLQRASSCLDQARSSWKVLGERAQRAGNERTPT